MKQPLKHWFKIKKYNEHALDFWNCSTLHACITSSVSSLIYFNWLRIFLAKPVRIIVMIEFEKFHGNTSARFSYKHSSVICNILIKFYVTKCCSYEIWRNENTQIESDMNFEMKFHRHSHVQWTSDVHPSLRRKKHWIENSKVELLWRLKQCCASKTNWKEEHRSGGSMSTSKHFKCVPGINYQFTCWKIVDILCKCTGHPRVHLRFRFLATIKWNFC